MHLSYSLARPRMQTGDVIAFANQSVVSRSPEPRTIRWASGGNVSHTGIVYRTEYVVELIEALGDGVQPTQLSQRIAEYLRTNGRVWWCPVQRPPAFNAAAMVRYLLAQKGKGYDLWQAIASVLWPWTRENARRMFCSEVVAGGLRAGNVLPKGLNVSRARPIDVCRWRIYASEPYQLLGQTEEIKGYNTVDPALWRAVPCAS